MHTGGTIDEVTDALHPDLAAAVAAADEKPGPANHGQPRSGRPRAPADWVERFVDLLLGG